MQSIQNSDLPKPASNVPQYPDIPSQSNQETTARYARKPFQLAKRVFDLIVGSVSLLCLLPLFLIVAGMVLLEDGLPVVFKQKRIGKDGVSFYIYKFRTMVKNAEEVLKSNPALLAEYLQTYKIERDPRILKVGRLLRSTSLDELPQLFNVVKGEMSLVGPRPIVASELEKYSDHKDVYLAMKPGCAGLWQCSGRSDTSYAERVQFDLDYYRVAGLRLDLWVLAKTFWAIINRHGAR